MCRQPIISYKVFDIETTENRYIINNRNDIPHTTTTTPDYDVEMKSSSSDSDSDDLQTVPRNYIK